MKEVVGTTDATDATAMTMILLLVRIIEQIANEARVLQRNIMYHKRESEREGERGSWKVSSYLAEAYAALFALLLHLLPRVALGADEFGECLAIEMMRFVLIMAEAALVKLIAARCLQRVQGKNYNTY